MSPLQPAPRPTPGRLHPARILLAAVLASAIALACADSGDGGEARPRRRPDASRWS